MKLFKPVILIFKMGLELAGFFLLQMIYSQRREETYTWSWTKVWKFN